MSLGVIAGIETGVPGRLIPLWSESVPPPATRAFTSLPETPITSRRMAPSLISTGSPIETSSASPSYEQEKRWALPRTGSAMMATSAPGSRRTLPPSILPTRIFGPCRSSSSPTGRPARSAAARTLPIARR